MYENIFSCKNKVAVVAGGNGLLGKEIVKALADFDAKVYIADLIEEDSSTPSQAGFVDLDISNGDSVSSAFEKVFNEEGQLDIFVNCAYPRTKAWGNTLENVDFDSWKEHLNSHLGGYFLASREAADRMKRTRGGSIINFSSIYGVVAPDFSIYQGTTMTMPVEYAAIKSGVIGVTQYLATYYGDFNVRANVISPGGIFDGQPEQFVEKYSQKTPLGRMGKPDEIIGAVVFLASNASSYVTGQNLLVDGGWTAW